MDSHALEIMNIVLRKFVVLTNKPTRLVSHNQTEEAVKVRMRVRMVPPASTELVALPSLVAKLV
jgi:hypothetical protein